MDDLFLKRVLFERLWNRQKEQTHAEIVSLKENSARVVNLLILQRWFLFFLYESLQRVHAV